MGQRQRSRRRLGGWLVQKLLEPIDVAFHHFEGVLDGLGGRQVNARSLKHLERIGLGSGAQEAQVILDSILLAPEDATRQRMGGRNAGRVLIDVVVHEEM